MADTATLEDCTVVWLCPLEVELRAAIAMMDRVFDDIPSRAKGQNVVYTIGEVGSHKVAIVGYYREQGLAVSGSMVAEVLRDLPNLEIGLLVGIAGGIPSPTRDIRLGDVTMAVPEGDHPGVVGYDLGKAGDNDMFELKHWQNATHPLLRSVINFIRARDGSGFLRLLRILDDRPEFQKPGSPHVSDNRLWNQPRNTTHPMIHCGTILSGNNVVKSQVKRDRLRDKYGGIAVEMEAAGVMTRRPVSTDVWQPYAAITAAVYSKEVLAKLPAEIKSNPPDIRLAHILPETWAFLGREEELSHLEDVLGFEEQQPLQKSVVGLWGLSGIGKSQLASRFVHQQRSKHPILLRGNNQLVSSDSTQSRDLHENRAGLVDFFFAELNRLEDQRWLLVIDGISGQLCLNTLETPSFNINRLITTLKRGYVLFTSRRRDMVEMYHPICEIRGLKKEDAVKLLQLQADTQFLVTLFKEQPLALQLATSVISRYRYEITDFLDIWKDSLCLCMDLGFQELEAASHIAANSFLDYRDLAYYPVLADLSFIELKYAANGQRFWEIHPAIQAAARQRTIDKEQEYIRCVVSLVAVQVPRSYEEKIWEKMRRLEPHATQCWNYIIQELDSFGRLFRHLGRYDQASFICRMIVKGLNQETLTVPSGEFPSDVYTNLGLVYIGQHKYGLALHAFDKSWNLRNQLDSLTPDITLSIMYNKSVAFMMAGRLEEAEENLRSAASHFARHKPDQYGLTKDERKRLYIQSVAAATDIFSHILDSHRGVLGESHPTIVSSKLNLAKANTQLDKFGVAHSLLQGVIAHYTEWWDCRHPNIMRAVDELASTFTKAGEHKMALGICAASQVQNFYWNTYGNQSDVARRIKTNLQHLYSLKLSHG
ncbi:hypothetical protein BDV26DRAFT_285801 [Aspergillus bertholletiae]|uniref:Uncharacterized protein n=1 Tax=Aspergillus bertholletiae TaxID=1226010 RepID=A0A5N7ARW9_9EURO|nr:hypothetical protein BDV26DRAFT_285801 [Aspergillus bertholletiae]